MFHLYTYIIIFIILNMQMITVEHPDIIAIITCAQLRTLTHLN